MIHRFVFLTFEVFYSKIGKDSNLRIQERDKNNVKKHHIEWQCFLKHIEMRWHLAMDRSQSQRLFHKGVKFEFGFKEEKECELVKRYKEKSLPDAT